MWRLQKTLVERRIKDEINDTLVLVEHNNVITLGRKTSPENLGPQKIPVFEVERGGDATYHGPGQLVGYPIVRLQDHDVRRFVRNLEEVLLRTTHRFGLSTGRKDGHRGVWIQGKKIASIGVAVENWVTYHGFALNVNTDLSYFRYIKPCGLDPETLTSMQAIAGRKFDLTEVKHRVEGDFAIVFNAGLQAVESQIALTNKAELQRLSK
ncbi:MAG: lipoyl(octanoyl) transferase LipB [Thaumarchaeota archaeon]|nr:lipoyl(octanoyl) transferase LipB [Nitrososphaerota archaeon]